jgi:large subunit ribosomal protein L9
MARNIELLLTENVDGTGIVGDVVRVRKGFARNYLLPRGMATQPSEEMIRNLAAKRAEVQRQLAELRRQREETTARLAGFELKLVRSCNDQGILYAAITQHDIATALGAAGFPGIKDREVRLGQTIKRIDKYAVHIKLDSDLDAEISLVVESDRPLDLKKPEAVEAAPAEAATPREKRQKDKSAKFETGKPEAAKETAETKPAPKARGKDRA